MGEGAKTVFWTPIDKDFEKSDFYRKLLMTGCNDVTLCCSSYVTHYEFAELVMQLKPDFATMDVCFC